MPPWPGPTRVEDDDDSDDSADKGIQLTSATAGRMRGTGYLIVQQAPVFFCGAAVAWLTLLLLWRPDDAGLRSELESARRLLVELRHTSDVLRVEVSEARRLLAGQVQSAGEGLETGRRLYQKELTAHELASTVHVLPGNTTSLHEFDTMSAASLDTEVLPPAAAWLFQALWPIGLFCLDTCLVYFCLRQFASNAAKARLEQLLLQALPHIGLGGIVPETHYKPPSPLSSKPVVTSAEAAAGSGRPVPNTGRVQPVAVDAFLVRRRENADLGDLAPVQRLQLQRQAEQVAKFRRRCSWAALAITSLASIATARLIARASGLLGLRFLNYLVMYAVLTVRVCLIVFVVLF
jgi:hypothetical protein